MWNAGEQVELPPAPIVRRAREAGPVDAGEVKGGGHNSFGVLVFCPAVGDPLDECRRTFPPVNSRVQAAQIRF